VQQGSSQAPLHWRIVWDIVLTLIQSHSKGFTFSYNNPPSIPAEYVEQCDPVSVSSTAFVDDTTLMSDSHEDISLQAKYCYLGMKFLNINANFKKQEAIGVNVPAGTPTVIMFGTNPVTIQAPGPPIRILGNFYDFRGSAKPTKDRINAKIAEMEGLIGPKAISDVIANCIINTVLVPQIAYLTKTMVLSASFLQAMDSKLRGLFKRIVGLKKSTPNAIIHHPQLYRLQSLVDGHFINHFTALELMVNNTGVIGKIARIMIKRVMIANAFTSPAELFTPRLRQNKKSFFTNLCALIGRNDGAVAFPAHFLFKLQAPSMSNAPVTSWQQVQNTCARHGIFYFQQLLTYDNRNLVPKAGVRNIMRAARRGATTKSADRVHGYGEEICDAIAKDSSVAKYFTNAPYPNPFKESVLFRYTL
jgi:hypothetical protein